MKKNLKDVIASVSTSVLDGSTEYDSAIASYNHLQSLAQKAGKKFNFFLCEVMAAGIARGEMDTITLTVTEEHFREMLSGARQLLEGATSSLQGEEFIASHREYVEFTRSSLDTRTRARMPLVDENDVDHYRALHRVAQANGIAEDLGEGEPEWQTRLMLEFRASKAKREAV